MGKAKARRSHAWRMSLAGIAATCVLGSGPMAAAPKTEHPAQSAVRAALAEARRAVEGEGERPAKLERLGEISRALFDTETMARRALGRHLEGRTQAQRAEFLELFDEYIVRAYLQKLLFFRKPRFAFATPEPEGEAVWVRTKIVTRKDDYFVDYRMERHERGWLASDVTVEHISLAENFAEQFSSLLERRSFDELLEKMRKKVERHRRKLAE